MNATETKIVRTTKGYPEAFRREMLAEFLSRAGRPGLVDMSKDGGNVSAAEKSPHPTDRSNQWYTLASVDQFYCMITVKISDRHKYDIAGQTWSRGDTEFPELDRLKTIAKEVEDVFASRLAPDPYADPTAGRSPEECENLGI